MRLIRNTIWRLLGICFWMFVMTPMVNWSMVAAEDVVSETQEESVVPDVTEEPESTETPQETATPTTTPASDKLKWSDAKKTIELKYDDRYTFSKKVVQITNISIKSKNVTTGKKDKNVVTLSSDSKKKIIASGCGKAVVKLSNGEIIGIKVSKASISLLLLIGQSNMEGSASDKNSIETYQKQWIINKEGTVYNTYVPSTKKKYKGTGCFSKKADPMTVETADLFVPQSLTQNTSKKEWCRTNNLTDAETATGKLGMDSALAKAWVKKTGEKVWLVNAAVSGSSIDEWNTKSDDSHLKRAVAIYNACQKLLSKEIEAGHYKLTHKGYYWMQGESDYKMSAEKYLEKYMKIHKYLKEHLSGKKLGKEYKNIEKKIEFAGLLSVRGNKKADGVSDMVMSGPRKAQFYMCTSSKKKFEGIYMASQISEYWNNDKGVKKYFKSIYKDTKDYLSKNPMISSPSLPKKLSEIHSTVHFSQLAYNEMGKDAAENICYALGYAKAPEEEVTICLVGEDGYTPVESITKSKKKDINLTVKVFPSYMAKKLEIKTTKGTKYDKWKVEFDAKKFLSGKLEFRVGKISKIYQVWSKNSKCKISTAFKSWSGVVLEWDELEKGKKYCVYRRKKGQDKWKKIGKIEGDDCYFLDVNVKEGTTYEYMILAYDKKENESQGEIVTVEF